MDHAPRFLALVDDARARVRETTVEAVRARQVAGEAFAFVDVREDGEWARGHAAGAVHLGKGVIERDAETRFPDLDAPIVLYCGGGYRSALAAEVLNAGFQAKVVCINQRHLDKSFCARDYNADFLRDLPPTVDPCGEDGDFHTFVTDAPNFAHPVTVEVEEIYEEVLSPSMGHSRFFYARLRS